MGDTDGDKKPDETADTPPADQVKPDSGKSEKPTEGADDAKDGKGDDKPADQKPADQPDPDLDEDPPVRTKTKQDYIKERRERKAAKDKAATDEPSGDDDETPDDGDDVDIDPDDERRISKVIDKKIGSRLQVLDQQAEKATLDEYFNSEDAKELNITPAEKTKIEKWWKHPSRNHLPVSSVAYEVLGKRLIKKGADLERSAADKERRDRPTGHAGKGGAAQKPVSELTTAEVEQQILDVKKRAADR